MARRINGPLALLAGLALVALAAAPSLAQDGDGHIPAPRAAQVASEGQPTAQAAEAADKGGGDSELHVIPGAPELIITLIIFLTLLVVLRATAWKPILAGLQNREKAIRDGVEAAARARADAERTTRELEARLAEAQAAAAQQIQQAKADALKLAESIRAQAETEAAALKDRALKEIGAARQQAVAEINGHAADLATAVARKILQRNVTADDQDRLVRESLEEIGKQQAALAGAQ